MKKLKKEDIKNFLDAFSGQIEKDEVELYKKLIDKGVVGDIKTPDDFYMNIIYPFKQFTSGMIRHEISDSYEVEFLLQNSDFIENNFEKIITKVEGMMSCADKSSTIMSRLLGFFLNDEKIEFDYDAKYTFHLPKRVFKTHDEILDFYKALKNLYYGDGELYFTEMLKITQIIKKKNEERESNKSK